MSENKNFFIGIDSGGTKFDIIITDSNKNVIFSSKYPSCHYSVNGAEETAKVLSGYVTKSLSKKGLKIENCAGICFGVAGAREEFDRKKLQKLFKSKLKVKNIIVVTDAMNAITGAFDGGDGIILIAGTGSVLYGKYKGKLQRVGGWGRILGDQGSGFIIGKAALRELVKEYDRRPLVNNKESVFSKLVSKRFGITSKSIVDKVFAKNFELQRVCETVMEAAEKKDKMCLKIVKEAAEELLENIRLYLKLAKVKGKIELAFVGSVIENENVLSKQLRNGIKRELKNVSVVQKKNEPTMGAVHIAMGAAK
jgi:N-acetylglucosamine kinase-like BadF-type ATPase